MATYSITVKKGLLEAKHFIAMGGDRNIGTIWLYLWILDKMTVIDKETQIGLVWGGKPVCYEDVVPQLGISRATYKRWLNMLREGGYISTLRTPKGLVISVHKAFKVFGLKTDEGRLSPAPSRRKVIGSVRAIDSQPMSHPWVTGEPSNIRQYIDNTKTIGKYVEKQETRSTESEAKERIRQMLKAGEPLNKLKGQKND